MDTQKIVAFLKLGIEEQDEAIELLQKADLRNQNDEISNHIRDCCWEASGYLKALKDTLAMIELKT